MPVAIALLLAAPPSPAASAFLFLRVSESLAPSRLPAVAGAAGGAVVAAWEDGGAGHVVSRALLDGVPLAVVDHGPGTAPALCSTPGGVVLAFARADTLVVLNGGAGGWSAPVLIRSGSGLPAASPDLGLTPSGEHGADVNLVWAETRGPDEVDIWFGRSMLGHWQAPELVAAGVLGSAEFVSPQIEPCSHGTGSIPRVYWLAGFIELIYKERRGEVWAGPFTVPGAYGVRVDVAAGPDGFNHILANGPQPTCPCNVMLYVKETAAGWDQAENLTLHFDHYDWPQYPAIGAGAGGVVHAFWFQASYNMMLEPTGESTHLFARSGSTWSDRSALLEGHVGIENDLALDAAGRPLLAWVEEAAAGGEVWVAVPAAGSAAPEVAPAPPGLRLTVSPNPLARTAVIEASGLGMGPARLRVVDPAGRCVDEHRLAPAGGGRASAVWDGRDGAGRGLPAGAYFLVIESEGREATARVTVIR